MPSRPRPAISGWPSSGGGVGVRGGAGMGMLLAIVLVEGGLFDPVSYWGACAI